MTFSNIKHIFLKELRSFFNSPVAYIVIIVYLLITGYIFTSGFFVSGRSTLRVVFEWTELLMIVLAPLMTMRLIAEEKRQGTLELLITKPVKEYEIIVGKFLAAWGLFFFTLLPTLCYYITVTSIGDLDTGAVIGGYLGLLLLGAVFLAISLLCSAITEYQIIAAFVSFAILGVLWLLNKVLIFLPNSVAPVVEYLGIDSHFANIARGVIDSRDLLYYFSMLGFSLMLGTYLLQKRRWS